MSYPNDYNLQVTLSPKQAHLVIRALDFYTRIGTGQIEELGNILDQLGVIETNRFDKDDPVMSELLKIKTEVLHHPVNGHHGIGNPNVHLDVKVIYDVLKCFEKGVATAENHGNHSVWHNGDILHLGDQPTPSVNIIRGEETIPVEVKQHRRGR